MINFLFQNKSGKVNSLYKTVIRRFVRVPIGIKGCDDIRQLASTSGVIILIQGLNKFFIEIVRFFGRLIPRQTFAHDEFPELAP
ncbi:hypothetical protein SDC9_198978 [bioreactor metagenome]|uniref:Uncharacterized protein n=1 Tax=bioreactor metagenome TaxID=1076179 RepID=A0A645IJ69_9ZZZZ